VSTHHSLTTSTANTLVHTEFALFRGILILLQNFAEFCRSSVMTDDLYDRLL